MTHVTGVSFTLFHGTFWPGSHLLSLGQGIKVLSMHWHMIWL